MGLSKKDYIAIADVLKRYKKQNEDIADFSVSSVIYSLAERLSEYFKSDNPRFDEQKFIDYINQ